MFIASSTSQGSVCDQHVSIQVIQFLLLLSLRVSHDHNLNFFQHEQYLYLSYPIPFFQIFIELSVDPLSTKIIFTEPEPTKALHL